MILIVTLCVAVFLPKDYVNPDEIEVLEKMAMLALVFYFTKDRKGDKNV